MATWSDRDIQAAVLAGRFKAEPWRPEDLTPNGLDLRIGHILVPASMAEPVEFGTVTVPPLTRFVIGTSTVVTLPADAVGALWIRSSWSRKGVIASFGQVDAGFSGNLTVGCFNASHEPITIPIGDRFCQIVLADLSSPSEKGYAARGRYQDQRGITLAKP
ncbi:MAG: dCTP deaminase [Candidatus Thermoplasmatota archaeon]